MFSLLTKVFSSVKSAVIAILALLLPVAFVLGMRSNKNRQEVRQLRDDVETLKESKETTREIQELNDTDLDAELARWMRD